MMLSKKIIMRNVGLAIATIFTVQFSLAGITSAHAISQTNAVSYASMAKASKAIFKSSKTWLDVSVGGTTTVTLSYDRKGVDNTKVRWESSNTSIVTVKNGVVTGVKSGSTTIIASYKGEEISIPVTVASGGSLEADTRSLSLKKGKTSTIELKYNNKSISGSSATWSTSNSSVATVKDGVVTAKGNGTAVVTAKYNGKSVEVTVKVNSNSSGKLEASDYEIALKTGERETISLTYDDDKLSGSKATWKTSKSSVATVSSSGMITAKGKGTATITAEYKGYEVEIEVKVDGKSSGKLLEADETTIKLKKGKKETIRLTYDGSKLSGSKATWKTSRSSVATVDDDGVITAKGKGTATITAGYKSEEVKIEVKVDTTGSDLLEASKSKISMSKGDKETIKLTYDGSSLTGSKASWSTSKSSVATVSNSGAVTAKAKGTATITAKYKGEEVEIEINVDSKGSSSDSLEAEDTSLTLQKGDTETIGLLYNNKSLAGIKADWSTSKSSVATVNSSGRVAAKAKGTATITAEYKGEKVRIKVTVK